ncbi:MAG: hypothetical protein R3C49_02345 [Planctomycetaceae bacterium]
MFLKIMAAILFARMLIGKHLRPMVSHFTIAAAAITAAQMSWEPGPLLYDVLGMSVLASIAFRSRDRFSAGELLMVVLVFCFWANFGHRFIVGTMLFLPGLCSRIIFVTRRSQAPDSDGRSTPGEPFGLRRAHCVIRDFRTTLVHGMGVCIPAIAACCISPAGTNGLWQSWAITFPQSVISATFLRPSGWQPWFDSLDSAEAVGLIVLTIVSCHRILYASDLRLCVILGIAHFLAIASKENLPVAAAWIAIYYVNSATSKSSPVPNSDRASHESDFSPDQVSRGRQLAAAVILFLAMCGLFRWPNSVSGPGWGLDAQLSPDAFSTSVQNLRLSGNAHCVGTREAGLLSWHCPDGPLPLDTPLTALLNGRLRQHVLFTQDLISGWKTVHRRPDGSEGGWWNAAQNFNIALVVVPSEEIALISALEPTIWKPFSLNAVSLAYGRAGDAGCAGRILDTLSLREFVNYGRWTFDPSSEDTSGCVDFSAAFSNAFRWRNSIRLARVFRAMGLQFAALKITATPSFRKEPVMLAEMCLNHAELGYRERLDCGRSSTFRALLVTELTDDLQQQSRRLESLGWSANELASEGQAFEKACGVYISEGARQAVQHLPMDLSEAAYARSVLLLETGDVDGSIEALDRYLNESAGLRLRTTAVNLRRSLAE